MFLSEIEAYPAFGVGAAMVDRVSDGVFRVCYKSLVLTACVVEWALFVHFNNQHSVIIIVTCIITQIFGHVKLRGLASL